MSNSRIIGEQYLTHSIFCRLIENLGRADIEVWYQQNIIVYFSEQALQNNQHLTPVPRHVSLNMVHPRVYETRVDSLKTQIEFLKAPPQLSLRTALKLLPSVAWSAAARRLKGTRL